MLRTLIRQGGGDGLTLYVPKKWITSHELKGGDEVEVDDAGECLIVNPKNSKLREATLNLLELSTAPIIVSHCYRLGYDRIILKGKPKILKFTEKKIMSKHMGFEVVKRTENELILENISETSDEKFDVLLRRAFLIIKDFGDKLLTGSTKEEILDFRNVTDKIIFFCFRKISKKMHSLKNPIIIWELLRYLMLIAHAYYYLAQYSMQKTMDKITIKYLKQVNDYFCMIYNAFYTKDLNLGIKIFKLKFQIVYGSADLLFKKAKDPVIIARIQGLARMIHLCVSPIFYSVCDQ